MQANVTMRLNVAGIKDTEISFSYTAEGYVTGSVTVPAGGNASIPLADVEYEDMLALILQADVYGTVTYKKNALSTDNFPLTNAILLAGSGMFQYFEDPPVQIYFENSGTQDVVITYTFVFDSHLESSSSLSSSISVSSDSSESSESSLSSNSVSSDSSSSDSVSSDSSSSTSI